MDTSAHNNSSPMAASSEKLLSLVEQIKQSILCENGPSPQTHSHLLGLIDQLRGAVETPTETILRLIYQPPQNAALRTVVDMGIFPLLVDSGETGVSAGELAKRIGAEKELIVRLMRIVSALGLCSNPELEVYRPTDKTAIMTGATGRDGVSCLYDLTLPTLAKLPDYFREHGYACPQDYDRSPMQWAVGQSQFEWLADRPQHQSLFNSYMASRRHGKPSWFDVYPVQRLMEDARSDEGSVLLVDIGGNQGHDLIKFQKRFGSKAGRLVLQDLPGIAVCSHPGIEVMEYSFFDPQPIYDARIYYFRAIFHDWPDHICRAILRNTVSAMDAEYSRIIIADFVLPDTNASLLQASMDIQMMSIGAGVERSERQWRELLHSVGLEIREIRGGSPGMESVIEAAVVNPKLEKL
ncbi:putative O-methyltransferase [Aspergillus clavatus NRRL 1]|uniref:O-methyltransferase, putative n=1 Tax=Aspergillus clavatus (strain ATCC 1007 / CBS 513.65 / DSM 816 / NCTC 3887 / NRRL 1 / QM 1276 / 107) TaxID=344612 RepID=A1C7A7_ASPCL|nr:O-methyltransferase, putative [Aspergillus clavatus NRRL 1]EAW14278.1 O-methyltransferase, putative [Aspergillus clavatus NRRL 1]